MKKFNNKKGFTIVELVIVIAVIGILAAVLIPTFLGVIDKANKSNALSEASNSLKVVLAELAEDGKVLGDATFLYVKDDKVVYTIEYINNQLGDVKPSENGKFKLEKDMTVYAKTSVATTPTYFTQNEGSSFKAVTTEDTTITAISKNIIILVAAPTTAESGSGN